MQRQTRRHTRTLGAKRTCTIWCNNTAEHSRWIGGLFLAAPCSLCVRRAPVSYTSSTAMKWRPASRAIFVFPVTAILFPYRGDLCKKGTIDWQSCDSDYCYKLVAIQSEKKKSCSIWSTTAVFAVIAAFSSLWPVISVELLRILDECSIVSFTAGFVILLLKGERTFSYISLYDTDQGFRFWRKTRKLNKIKILECE